MFGWKFWAIVSGGAALPAAVEKFWQRLGFAAIQGYGLTETTSLVSVNHPFHLGAGSIGKSLPGLELKLSEQGEILVRGENVAAGYWKDSGVAPVLDADGWFHTGDLGERDAAGNLYFKGRLKNVIVTPAGLNIFPEDLEAELRKQPDVRDCVVIGLERDGNAEPCAVLLLRWPEAAHPAADLRHRTDLSVPEGAAYQGALAPEGYAGRPDLAAEIIARANARLAPFQQMRLWLVWPERDFPRTPTQKPVLARIRAVAEAAVGAGAAPPAPAAASPLGGLLEKISRGNVPLTGAGPGADLNLTSIERVELMSALEDRYQVDLSETDFSNVTTAGALVQLLEQPRASAMEFHYPRWPRLWPVRWIRAAAFYGLVRPAMLLLGWPRVEGRERLREIEGPVLIVSNHVTYLDPGFVLTALPARLRRRTAIAMEGELLEAMRKPLPGTRVFRRILGRIQYPLVTALFHVFPLPTRAGFRKSFSFAGELVDRGWSVLVFPEGELTKDGAMAPFRAGIGLLVTRLGLPVIPVRLDGLYDLKQANKHCTAPGHIRVTVGAPVEFRETEAPEEIARALERCVAALGQGEP